MCAQILAYRVCGAFWALFCFAACAFVACAQNLSFSKKAILLKFCEFLRKFLVNLRKICGIWCEFNEILMKFAKNA